MWKDGEKTATLRSLVPFGRRFHEFGVRDDGTIAVIFGFSALAIMLCVGAAVDYSRWAAAKAHLDGIADTAVLAAVRTEQFNAPTAAAEAAAIRTFQAQQKTSLDARVTAIKVAITDKDGQREATLTYEAVIETVFMQLASVSTMRIAGRSTAASRRPVFIDFYLLLDNTPSMGLAATQAGIDRMRLLTAKSRTFPNCAFACHQPQEDRLALARNNGIATRVDVARRATQRLLDTAAATALIPDQFRAAIYDYGQRCSPAQLNEVSPLTVNLGAARSAAEAVQLMTTPTTTTANTRCTDHRKVLQLMSSRIPVAGDGQTSATAQKVLFFVSDGMTNVDRGYQAICLEVMREANRCVEPIDPKECNALKQRGVTVAVLYTTYMPLIGDETYDRLKMETFRPGMSAKMRACASPGFFFEVTPTQGIEEAMIALFQKVIALVRLTS